MPHKKKAYQKQKAAVSDPVSHSGITPSGTLIHQSDIIDSGVSDPHNMGSIRKAESVIYRLSFLFVMRFGS